MKTRSHLAALCRTILPLLLLPALAATLAQAQPTPNPPGQISYQGFVVDANGIPLATNAPKNYDMVFRIYNAPANGTPLWGELQTVTVDRGYFSVMLGQGSSVPGAPSTNNLGSIFVGSDASDRYVGVVVKGLAGGDLEILPRLRLLASPYSFLAATANFAVNAASASFASSAASASLATNAQNAQNLGNLSSTNIIPAMVPVGAVLPYYGDLGSLTANWKYCDGSKVTDSQSPLNGQFVPDLREKFVRGTGPASDATLGYNGGIDTIPNHTHPFEHKHSVYIDTDTSYYGGYYYPSVNLAGGGNAFVAGGTSASEINHYHVVNGYTSSFPEDPSSTSSSPIYKLNTDAAGGHDNRPAYLALHYIIRIR